MNRTLHLRSEHVIRIAPGHSVKLADGPKGVIKGYGSTFNDVPDAYGDVIAPGAFARSLAEHRAAGTMPVMLWQHRSDEPIGRWTDIHEDDKGLSLTGQLNLGTTRGKDAHAHLVAGDVSGLSIGFFINEGGQESRADGTSLLTDLDLAEVSIVTFPANRSARIGHAKTLKSKSELVALLREGGLSIMAAQRVAAGGWAALSSKDDRAITQLAERIAQATVNLWSI
ncbi:HK97 family phage prohead protease [Aureimonas sp. D3]|uniref:HK97 family phage prohead protease n=1 Tax=Aureimonas sp. D3 TaxID=1638164 RepID=UPI000785EE72|nr:HK97 family phage prohead protease [Aureimonas sp. D3]